MGNFLASTRIRSPSGVLATGCDEVQMTEDIHLLSPDRNFTSLHAERPDGGMRLFEVLHFTP